MVSSAHPPENVDPDDWRKLQELIHLAKKMALGASTLIRPRKLSAQRLALPDVLRMEAQQHQELVDSILDRLRAAEDSPDDRRVWWQIYQLLSPHSPDDPRVQQAIFDSYFEAEADRLFGTSLETLAQRMARLMPYLLREQGQLTTAYLTRVAGCYVREMKPEFAVMARAVLDSAIQERLDDEAVRRATRPGQVTLASRIQACLKVGLFDDEVFRSAGRLREAGKNAAHLSPGLEGDLDELLDDLVSCLRALEAR